MSISKPISNFLNWATTDYHFRTMTSIGTACASLKVRSIESNLIQMLDKLTLPNINAGDINRLHEDYLTARKFTILVKGATITCNGLRMLASSEKVAMYKAAEFFGKATGVLCPIEGAALLYEISTASQIVEKFNSALKQD